MTKQMRADGLLVLITFFWGISYLLMDISLNELDPFTLNSFRFLGAFFIAGIASWKRLVNVNKTTLMYSIIIGSLMVFVYLGATFGVKYTSISNSGFLCSLTVIFTPIIEWLFLRKIPDKRLSIAIIVCTVGIGLLTLGDGFSLGAGHLKGDLLCLICAFSYSITLISTEKAVGNEKVDAFQLGVLQIGVTGTWNLLLAFIFETPSLPGSAEVWASAIFLSIFCTGLAFIIQPIAMKDTTASHVGVIFSLEPVFSAIVAFIFANERLSAKAYFGAFLMMSSIFIMELDFKTFFKKKREG